MTAHVFACTRSNAPKDQKSFCGLFTRETALEYGQQWADEDGAPVEITREGGSGEVSTHVTTLYPRHE